jgi:hypothetical protein
VKPIQSYVEPERWGGGVVSAMLGYNKRDLISEESKLSCSTTGGCCSRVTGTSHKRKKIKKIKKTNKELLILIPLLPCSLV